MLRIETSTKKTKGRHILFPLIMNTHLRKLNKIYLTKSKELNIELSPKTM